MNKIIAFLQKRSGIFLIVVYALMAIYALCMATPCANLLQYQDELDFYDAIQPYNDGILYFAIAGLLLALNYNDLRNHERQIYYVSNFAYFGVTLAYLLASGIYLIVAVSFYQGKYSALDFTKINAYFESMHFSIRMNPHTPVFAFGYVIATLLFVLAVLLALVLAKNIKERLAYNQRKKDGTSAKIQEVK